MQKLFGSILPIDKIKAFPYERNEPGWNWHDIKGSRRGGMQKAHKSRRP